MKWFFLKSIRAYQKVSPLRFYFVKTFTGSHGLECCFSPTCSEYAHRAVDKYGVAKGGWLASKRFIKCHPWSKGGHDPVP